MRMVKDRSKDSERIKEKCNNSADRFDEWYKTFQGAVGSYVDWELLKKYLPENKNAKILDAAGGIGRITLPLAKKGYSLTLCDISPIMLDAARQKMLRGGVFDKVKILECDVINLPFANESFDFVLCWDGAFEATEELIRVTKKGGRISIFLVNKWAAAINNYYKDPDSALSLIESSPSYLEDEEGKRRADSIEEARELFGAKRIRVIDIYAVWGWLDVLNIPEGVLESRNWDERFFKQTTEMVLRLSKEPSIKGMTRHLVLYGEKM